MPSWKKYTEQLPTETEARRWTEKSAGIAIIGGAVSSNLEILDIDDPEIAGPFVAALKLQAPELPGKLTRIRTPRRNQHGKAGGHFVYRCESPVSGNLKLAMSAPEPEVDADGEPVINPATGKQNRKPRTLLETRGEGGYALTIGCTPEYHPTGNLYEHAGGPPLTELAVLTESERRILHDVAHSFDYGLGNAHVDSPIPGYERHEPGKSPGDAFNQRATWEEMIEPHGWKKVTAAGGISRWRRPGKADGYSATTGIQSKAGNELLCVFSTNAYPFEGVTTEGRSGVTYNKFSAFAQLNHDGDFQAAARDLLAKGYGQARKPDGDKPQRPRKRFDPPPPWKPFPTETIPEPIQGYIKAGAHAMRCDESFVALPMLAGLASAIGATHPIKLKAGWCEPSVVWAAVVSESGTMKSPAQSLALRMLSKAQEWRLEEYPEILEQYKRGKLLHEADVQAWKKKGRAKCEPPPEEPDEPQPVRYLVNDATIEALAELLENNPRGLLVSCDELNSWLGSFDQYRGGRGGDAAKWLSIHRAESLIVDRKTGVKKTVFVKRAAVSVAGSIQPTTLCRSLGNQHFENGLAARMLLAAPPRRAKKWSEASVDRETYKAVERVFSRLLALDFGVDDNDQPSPIDLPLSPEAKRVWVGFYDDHGAVGEGLTLQN